MANAIDGHPLEHPPLHSRTTSRASIGHTPRLTRRNGLAFSRAPRGRIPPSGGTGRDADAARSGVGGNAGLGPEFDTVHDPHREVDWRFDATPTFEKRNIPFVAVDQRQPN